MYELCTPQQTVQHTTHELCHTLRQLNCLSKPKLNY